MPSVCLCFCTHPVLCRGAHRSSLRSPQGRLPPSIFSATPNPQNPITGALGALGPLRPAFSNTTAAQQALLLPGPDSSPLFKLIWRQQLPAGAVPDAAVQATDAAGRPLLCVVCSGAQQLLAFELPWCVHGVGLGMWAGCPAGIGGTDAGTAMWALPCLTAAAVIDPAVSWFVCVLRHWLSWQAVT